MWVGVSEQKLVGEDVSPEGPDAKLIGEGNKRVTKTCDARTRQGYVNWKEAGPPFKMPNWFEKVVILK